MNLNNEKINLKTTPFYTQHVKLGAKFAPFAGFNMPIRYKTVKEEHLEVRNKAGIFDVSHMGEIVIKGKNMLSFSNFLLTNTLKTPGKAYYSLMLNKNGGIVDDLVAYYMENEILLVVNAANIEKDYRHILNVKKEFSFDVTIENQSDEYFQIAFQGPKTKTLIKEIFPEFDVSELGFFRFKIVDFLGEKIIVSRTGYTGEFGYEIYGKHFDVGNIMWTRFIEKGVSPIGLGARDSLRQEAGLLLYGVDMDEDTLPSEAGLDFVVKKDKDFYGKDALLQKKARKKLYPFFYELKKGPLPRQDKNIYSKDGKNGFITSANMSFVLDRVMLLGYLYDETKDDLFVKIHGKDYKLEKTKLPFVSKNK